MGVKIHPRKALAFVWIVAFIGALASGLKWLYESYASVKARLSGVTVLDPCPRWALMMGIGFILAACALLFALRMVIWNGRDEAKL